MSSLEELSARRSPVKCGSRARVQARGFTLVELLVVIIIISILSAMTLGGMAGAAKSSRTQSTSLIIRSLNDALMARYEEYEDIALTASDIRELRKQMRQEMPDAWADVADLSAGSASPARPGFKATSPTGVAYARYKERRKAVSTKYQSAECLYMILTESGFFNDFLENVRPDRVGDIDADGAKEFLDGWGNPIAFFRWAPGFSFPYSPIQFNFSSPESYHDPIDDAGLDSTAFALYPLIYSPGVDGDYGLVPSDTGWAGWPDANLEVTSPNTPCSYQPTGQLVGAPDATNAYRDNITNHSLLAQ